MRLKQIIPKKKKIDLEAYDKLVVLAQKRELLCRR